MLGSLLALVDRYVPYFQPADFLVLVVSFFSWFLVEWLAQVIASPQPFYQKLPPKLKVQWNARNCALLHSVLILPPAAYLLLFDRALAADVVFGHSTAASFLFAFTTGYFFWDVVHCIIHFKENGPQFTIHAVTCTLVYTGCMVSLLLLQN